MLLRIVSVFAATALLMAMTLDAAEQNRWKRQPLRVPQDNALTPERIELGKLLYFDTRLSRDMSISCASCHHPDKGWGDGIAKAVGVGGAQGTRNSPTVLNSAYNIHHFWDGRAASLEEQALGPIQADVEMDMKLDDVIKRLQAIPGYVSRFEAAYPGEGITETTLAKALASFERTVISGDAPFDRYIEGNTNAISEEARRGFELFRGKAGCVVCHDGFNFTDGSYHNLALGDADEGRYRLKRRAAWFHAFKTPSLRDAPRTAPYFHDGSVKTLHEAAAICSGGGRFPNDAKKSSFLVDHNLSRREQTDLVAFLQTLECEPPDITIPKEFPQ